MLIPLILLLVVAMLISAFAFTSRQVTAGSDKELQEMRERMLRLEQSVELMASEMERVSEGQRFMTALLEDRARSQTPLNPPAGGDRLGG